MNKSLKYILNRLKNPESVGNYIPLNGWEEAVIIKPFERWKMNPEVANIIHDDKIEVKLKANGKEIILGVIYDADANFDYFINTKTTHDGTCIFTEQAILELLNKMLFLKTCYNNASEEFIDNPLDYNIKYIIGDILIHNDFGMKNINGNMIYAQTETLVLPIKFEYIKREI